MIRAKTLATCLVVTSMAATSAQAQFCAPDAMLVFDGSGSMAEMGFNDIPEPRIFDARRAINEVIPEIAASRRVGLVVYGPGAGETCAGVDLRFRPSANAAERIIAEIDALQPAGQTALTDAVALAAHSLDYRNQPGVIVLVTDGKETCGGTPCQLAAQLRAEAHDLTIHVIGFKVRGDQFSYDDDSDYQNTDSVAQCMADQTGGHYLNTETADELIGALRQTLGCQLLL